MKEPSITNARIVMINSDFKINKNIFQNEFCEILAQKHVNNGGNFTNIIFQPSKYPAINTKVISDDKLSVFREHTSKHGIKKKFEGMISLLIFRSGSVIITGGKDIKSYFEIYIKIIELFKLNKNILHS